MGFRELAIPGSWIISPPHFGDDRGTFFEWLNAAAFEEMTGHRFAIRQANCSISRAGALRGLHFAQVPPGQAKYVTCTKGAVFDVVVDIRVGSPTFGRWDAAVLDDVDHNSMYLAEGLAHGFLALEEDSTVMYLCSAPYAPDREHTVNPLDPNIGIRWPIEADQLVLSDRDAAAPLLDEVAAAGVLPSWSETQAFVEALRRASSS